MSLTKRAAFSRVLAAVCVSTSIRVCVCVCARDEKMRIGSRKWECMSLFTLGHMLVEPPIRLTAGGLSLGKKPKVSGIARSDRRPEALVHSLFCIIAPRVTCRRARPSDRSASQVLPRVFPPELRGLLRRQRGQRCVCLSRSDCSPGLQGKLKSTDTH